MFDARAQHECAALPLSCRIPENVGPHTPIFVCVHGISRNDDAHFEAFNQAFSENWAVVAPRFDEETHPRYQTLGLNADTVRADIALITALAELRRIHSIETNRIHLFGFSGGAQFAHRFAMLYPRYVQSLSLCAAGHYTFLDLVEDWPRGLKGLPQGRRIFQNRTAFLRIPTFVLVGDQDVDTASLKRGPKINRQQGSTRLERAKAWAKHIDQQRHWIGERPDFDEMPGVAHCFTEAVTTGLADKVASFARQNSDTSLTALTNPGAVRTSTERSDSVFSAIVS